MRRYAQGFDRCLHLSLLIQCRVMCNKDTDAIGSVFTPAAFSETNCRVEAQLIKTLDRNETQHQTFITAHQIKLIPLPLLPNYVRRNQINKALGADLPLFFFTESMGSPTVWLSKAPHWRGDEGPPVSRLLFAFHATCFSHDRLAFLSSSSWAYSPLQQAEETGGASGCPQSMNWPERANWRLSFVQLKST